MDLFLLFLVVGAAFAIRAAWRHATETRGKSRAAAIRKAAGKSPKPLSKPRQKMIARQHDTGWWLSEAAHGFPVLRTGLHAGWLAHKAAALHGRHKVEEARTTQAEIRAGLAAAMAEHRKRQAAALADIRAFIDEDPAAGKKAVQKAAGNVLPFARPKGTEPAPSPQPDPEPAREPGPGPYAPKADPPDEPACSACGHPARPGDDLVPTPEGWNVHESHLTDQQSGFYQPPPTEGNHSMPTGTATASDATYDGTQRELTQMAVKIEGAINDIRFEQIQNQIEQVAAVVSDPQTLGELSDTAEELQRAKEQLQRALDSTLSAKSRLRHNHGHLNEAHQSNPVAPADKEFYEEG